MENQSIYDLTNQKRYAVDNEFVSPYWFRPSSAYSYSRPAHYYESPPVTSPRGSVGSSYQSSPQHHSSAGSFNASPSHQASRAAMGGTSTRLMPTSVSATPLGGGASSRKNSSAMSSRPGSAKRINLGDKVTYGTYGTTEAACAGDQSADQQHLHLARTTSAGVVKTGSTLDAQTRLAASRGSSVSWDYTLHQYATGVHLSPRVSPHQSANNSRNSSVVSSTSRLQVGIYPLKQKRRKDHDLLIYTLQSANHLNLIFERISALKYCTVCAATEKDFMTRRSCDLINM